MALATEAIVVVVVGWAVAEAFVGSIYVVITERGEIGTDGRREVWFRFATWIVLALEFALAADIIRSAIAPTWNDIGKLAAIAVIRTVLNYFLVRDVNEFTNSRRERAKEQEPVNAVG